MTAKEPVWTTTNSDFLSDLTPAFRKRSKAIKHKFSAWEMSAEIETKTGRLNMDFVKLGCQIRLSA